MSWETLREACVKEVQLKQSKLLNFTKVFPGHLVVESSSSQNHGDLIGPLWFILPLPHLMVPEVQAAWVAHKPVWEFPPYLEQDREQMSYGENYQIILEDK